MNCTPAKDCCVLTSVLLSRLGRKKRRARSNHSEGPLTEMDMDMQVCRAPVCVCVCAVCVVYVCCYADLICMYVSSK